MDSKQTDKELRQFGYIFGTIFPILMYLKWGRSSVTTTAIAVALCVYCITGATLKPSILRPLNSALAIIFKAIQQVCMYVILVICFYFIITPIGTILRLLNKDILDIKIDPSKKTFWKEREIKTFPPNHYKNQF